MRVLYIPADNISANFSRSYHIAKNLSLHCDLFRVMWKDNRSAFWQGEGESTFNSLNCFLKSLFQKTSVKKSHDFGHEVYASVFISAFIGRIIGKYTSLRLMRNYNSRTLNKLIKLVNPDIVFHADGYFFFPASNSSIPHFSDLQDDINWNNIPEKKLIEAREYYTTQFNLSKLNFIVSESAKQSICKYIQSDFIPISNGADFSIISSISEEKKREFKEKYSIPNTNKIVSYIGGEHKFDKSFTKKLIRQAYKEMPRLTFVLAGNLPTFESPNVIFTGIISNNEANVLYAISDVGLTLKNTKNNDFIYNSVPLKFIQYAAAKKPIVSFPIKWSVNSNFSNITHIDSENINEWIQKITLMLNTFKWNDELTVIWEKYDWKNIANTIYNEIESSL